MTDYTEYIKYMENTVSKFTNEEINIFIDSLESCGNGSLQQFIFYIDKHDFFMVYQEDNGMVYEAKRTKESLVKLDYFLDGCSCVALGYII